MTIDQYLSVINSKYKQGYATEHTFRGNLEQLIETIVPEIRATNEPKRQACGAPDYILTRGDIEIGYIEAKDIGDKDLAGAKKTGNKEQFDRYKAGLPNLIFTDYIDFHFYRNEELITKIAIGEVQDGEIVPIPENFTSFINLIKDFTVHVSQTIRSAKRLAELMAGKARLLSDVIEKSLINDEKDHADSTLHDQMIAFKEILIHDITPKGFADVYAQTIAYGMFAARLHDPTLPTFSRQEAAELIPKTNPFLRKLFGYIAGPDIDDRIKFIVNGLVDIFLACNVEKLLKNYGKATKMEEPIIHFYETFLSEYDPKLRKARGVWYTPQPVVNFIVRAVDDILKTEFGLSQGLADTSKTKIKLNTQTADKRSSTGYKKVEQEVHKVQILDPATGTGTFLAEITKHVHRKFSGQQGIWSNYVENHLLPRLNGFELLMASYAMAHLQLNLLLTDTGYKPTKNQRLRVYLTNSLEESHPDTGTLFANWLSTEANEANQIKRDTPVMCVIGNPPYSVSSTNKGEWILNLISSYKRGLNERKINLDDDYIKFIRYGQHYIDKNGSGILAYISNNSFIDGITHREMRRSLLRTFDEIYILDLHGSIKKNEKAPDGGKDENVFDIQQGVSINVFVKTGKKKSHELGKVLHFDLFGNRESKYRYLTSSDFYDIKWMTLDNVEPYLFFVPKDFGFKDKYTAGFKVDELFKKNVSGFQTKRDKITINFSSDELHLVKEIFENNKDEEIRNILRLPKDGRDWTIKSAKSDLISNKPRIIKIMYRPFDERFTFFTGKSKGFVAYPRAEIASHLNKQDSLSLITCRQQSTYDFQHVFISRLLSDMCNISSQTKETGYIFPLYLYSESGIERNELTCCERYPNLNMNIVNEIVEVLGLSFTNEKGKNEHSIAPIDILDYIYAVLHSPTYREKYKEFLKIDFPRVPYPANQETFGKLVKLGSELRQIHLLESPIIDQYITQYPIDGDNTVDKPNYKACKVYINDTQYFDSVPEIAWTFFIGGYQPAQKWLKDRRGRELDFEDILHYQKIIVALTETDRVMKEIDLIDF